MSAARRPTYKFTGLLLSPFAAQAILDCTDEIERLRSALSAVLASDVGRQTQHKMADGQGEQAP